MQPTLKLSLALSTALFLVAACSTATPLPASTAPPAPPTATPVPYYENVTLTATMQSETGQDPDHTITTQLPTLTGSDDPRLAAFNALAASIVQQAVDEFKANLVDMQPLPDAGIPSSFDLRFTPFSALARVIGIKFEMSGFIEGMAHPYNLSRTLNFDLETGQEIGLDSLFLPGSDYLVVIANHCAAQLSTRDIGFDMFAEGASPTSENYRNWNITPNGLLITFEQYQVAPGAAGAQTVTVPYAEIAGVIDPQGLLATFLP